MIKIKFLDQPERDWDAEFSAITPNVIRLLGEIPENTSGFLTYRDETDLSEEFVLGDFSDYTTVYRQIEGGYQLSNDGSVYVPPAPSPEVPEPEPPTTEELQEEKIKQMNADQQKAIENGVDVLLTSGVTEHFTLTTNDQLSLMGLQGKIITGAEQIPWHTSDTSEHCKFYSNADAQLIVDAALQYVTYHVTYFRDLRIYIRSLQTKEEISNVFYGMEIPEEFKSEPLRVITGETI